MIYTTTEMHKLDDQRESLTISNDQYKRKLNESSSTSEGAPEATETTSSNYNYTSVTQSTVESYSQPSTVTYTIGDHNYNFEASDLTIQDDNGERKAQMSELMHKYPILITDANGTQEAWLIADNNDSNCYIQVYDTVLYNSIQSSVYDN
ncbi:hypothetical protein [Enterococcus lactis]|uniref:hypothetical protein n=1 Tax=Enterococcus lactis TaxID=357441 RepID=UPI0040429809